MSVKNDIDDGDQLFLLELFVNKLYLSKDKYGERDIKQLQLQFTFLDFPPFEIAPIDADSSTLGEDAGSFIIPFQTGKSCFFGSETSVLSAGLVHHALLVNLKQNNQLVAEVDVSLSNVLSQIIAQAKSFPDEAPISKSVKDKFIFRDVKNDGETLGAVALFVRLSWNGKQVITDFKRLGNDNTFVFKATGTDCVFRCKSRKGCSDCFLGTQEGGIPNHLGANAEAVSSIMDESNAIHSMEGSSTTTHTNPNTMNGSKVTVSQSRSQIPHEDSHSQKTILDIEETIQTSPNEEMKIRMKQKQILQDRKSYGNVDMTRVVQVDQKLGRDSTNSEIMSIKHENTTIRNNNQSESTDVVSLSQYNQPGDVDSPYTNITSTVTVPKGYHRDPGDPSVVWIGKDGYRVVRISQGPGYTNGDVMATYIHIASENMGVEPNLGTAYRKSTITSKLGKVKRRRSTPDVTSEIPYCHIGVNAGHKKCIELPVRVPKDQGWFKTPSVLEILRKSRSYAGMLKGDHSAEKRSRMARKRVTFRPRGKPKKGKQKEYSYTTGTPTFAKEIRKELDSNKAVSQTTVSLFGPQKSSQKVGVEAITISPSQRKIGIQAKDKSGTGGNMKLKVVHKSHGTSPAKEVMLDLESTSLATKRLKTATATTSAQQIDVSSSAQKKKKAKGIPDLEAATIVKEPIKKGKVKEAPSDLEEPIKKGKGKEAPTDVDTDATDKEPVKKAKAKAKKPKPKKKKAGAKDGDSQYDSDSTPKDISDVETARRELFPDQPLVELSTNQDIEMSKRGAYNQSQDEDIGMRLAYEELTPDKELKERLEMEDQNGIVYDGMSASGGVEMKGSRHAPSASRAEDAYDSLSTSSQSSGGYDDTTMSSRAGKGSSYVKPSSSRAGGVGMEMEGTYYDPSALHSARVPVGMELEGAYEATSAYLTGSADSASSGVRPGKSSMKRKSPPGDMPSVTFDSSSSSGKVYKFVTGPDDNEYDASVTFNVIISKKRSRK